MNGIMLLSATFRTSGLVGWLALPLATGAQAQTLAPINLQPASDEARLYLRECPTNSIENQNWCDFNRSAFIKEYAAAKANDYAAQRSIAFLLAGGIKHEAVNPVVPNAMQACAWRHVILRSGHAQVSESDTRNTAVDCGKPGVAMTAVNARVEVILQETKSLAARSTTSPRWFEMNPHRPRTSMQARRLPLTPPQAGTAFGAETFPFNTDRSPR